MCTKSEISKIGSQTTYTKQEESTGIWFIIWLGLAPLVFLAIIGAIVIALIILIRHLMDSNSFLLQQKIFIIIMIIGMAIAIIGYSISVIYALRKIGMLRRSGHTRQANAGLIALTIVATIMILPVILALFFH